MDVRILGVVAAHAGGQPVALGARKQRAVFAMLALEANTPVLADHIVEGLWGESLPPSAHKMVQVYVSQLRKALQGADAEIVTRGRAYELVCDPDDVDLHQARRLIAAALDEPTPNGHARAALALWRGPTLADVADEPFAAEAIRACEELRLRAHELAIDADLARGRHAVVLDELRTLAAEHPLRERLQAQYLLALYRCGQQAEALQAYPIARRRIVEAIGTEPGPELRRVHEAILHHADATPPAAGGPVPVRRSRGRRGIAAVAMAAIGAVGGFVLTREHGGESPRLVEDTVAVLDGGALGVRAIERVGRGPEAVAVGAGSTWVANALDDTVTRIDHGHRQVTIAVGAHPSVVAFGAGSLWVVSGDDGTVAQVDPTTNRVAQRIPVGGQPAGLTVGNGAVWVALPREQAVVRVDLSAGRVTRRIPVGGGPTAVAASDDAVWVVAEDSDQLVRIDPASGAVTASVGVGHGPNAVAVGVGAVWVANGADGTVSRVDPSAVAVVGTVSVGAEIVALAAGDRAVLAADGRGVVAQIDGPKVQVTARLATGAGVRAIVEDGDRFWVTAGVARERHRGGTLTTYAGGCGAPCPVDPGFPLDQTFGAVGLAYDGLVGYRRAPGVAGATVVPVLATAVPVPRDGGRTYAFTLRHGLRYADGRPVRASDVRSSLERSIRVGHELALGLFDGILGAPACERRPGQCSLARGVTTDDRARTVTIRLRRPDPVFLLKLAHPSASVVPAGTPDAVTGPRPPGTGPYRIASIAGDGTTRLVRNRRFHSPSAARPGGFADAIVFRPWSGLRPRLRTVERGRSDLTVVDNGGRQLRPDDLGGVLTRHPGRVAAGPRLATDYMFLNVGEPPFDDARVRRAVNLATDRARMVQLAGGPAAAVPACSILPPGLPHMRPWCPYTARPSPAGTWTAPDLRRARRLIAASGTRGAAVTVWTDTDKVRYGRYFIGLLRRLGYRPRLKVVRAGFDYFRAVGKPGTHAQMGMFGWAADYPDAASFLEPTFSCAARRTASPEKLNYNLSQLCDPALDRVVAEATRADGPATTDAWTQAQRRLAALAPAVPLVWRRRTLFVSHRAGNLRQSPFLGPLIEQMWVH
ncbi:MAG TPA: ABC transporter substrate-binding protein [Thermoleophilaceae bacterium]|nr:ABC transporter substrate-binding protein [Thermoleophilaceae bacterium]